MNKLKNFGSLVSFLQKWCLSGLFWGINETTVLLGLAQHIHWSVNKLFIHQSLCWSFDKNVVTRGSQEPNSMFSSRNNSSVLLIQCSGKFIEHNCVNNRLIILCLISDSWPLPMNLHKIIRRLEWWARQLENISSKALVFQDSAEWVLVAGPALASSTRFVRLGVRPSSEF